MSEVPQGPGWWIASDGRWYPPHLHPSVRPAPQPQPQPQPAQFSQQPAYSLQPPAYPPQPSPLSHHAVLALVLSVVVWPAGLVVALVARRELRRTGGRGAALLAASFLAAAAMALVTLAVLVVVLSATAKSAAPTTAPMTVPNTVTQADKQAQSDLVNALVASKAIYTQTGQYPPTATMVRPGSGDLVRQEPELRYTSGPSTQVTEVSVFTNTAATTGAGQQLILASYANSGVCWILKDVETAGATAAVGVRYAFTVTSSAICAAARFAATVPASGWGSDYP